MEKVLDNLEQEKEDEDYEYPKKYEKIWKYAAKVKS